MLQVKSAAMPEETGARNEGEKRMAKEVTHSKHLNVEVITTEVLSDRKQSIGRV